MNLTYIMNNLVLLDYLKSIQKAVSTKLPVLTLLVIALSGNELQAQLSLTNGTPSVTIDFATTIAGVSNGAFTAAGYQPVPAAGQLDSDGWAITGWSDGALAFGGTRTTANTDYVRNTTAIAVVTGGTYANNAAGNTVLMMQPGTNDFTSGTMTLKIINNGTSLINQIAVSYKIFQRNDQPRSQTIKFSYSSDDVTYTPVGALDYSTPLTADAFGWVVGATQSATLPISLPQTSVCYIRWTSDDNGGGGSRDEIGFDDIIITGTYPGVCTPPTIPATLNSFSNVLGNQMTVNFTRGNGTGGMLAVVSPAALSQNPISGIPYVANSNYATGTALGNGFVVYNSNAPSGSFTITGLNVTTSYNVNLFEYDVTVPCYTLAGILGVQSTGAPSLIPSSQFQSNGTTGNWANAFTWDYFDGLGWVAADRIPTAADVTITIQPTHTVDISCPASLDQTTVSGTLTLSNRGIMNLGTGLAIDIQSGGILRFQTTANYTTAFQNPSAATLNVATGGKITIGNGASTPGYSPLGHQVSLVTWNNGAVYEWNTTDPFITSGVTYFPGAAAGTIPIFRVTKSPSLVPGSASPTVWNGLMEVNANLTLKFNGSKTFRDGIIGSANLTQDDDCGQFIISGTSAVLGGTGIITLNNLSGVGNADIVNAAIVTMTSDKVINGLNVGILRLNTGGSLYCDAYTITGSMNFIMQASSTLRLGSPGGISSSGNSGNIQNSGIRSIGATCNFIYNGTANQVTGNGMPTSISSLTISAGAGISVTLTTTNTTTPILTLTAGLFASGTGQQLNISTGGTVPVTAGNFVTGATAGIINFQGTGTFSGTSSPYNVHASGGVNFGTPGIVTIQNGGSFRINTGGFAQTNGPYYAVGSTLIYNTGLAFAAGNEWLNGAVIPARSGPFNVTILASGTSVTFGAAGSARTMGGDLNINSGTSLTLGTVANGDLNIGGNWTRAATGTFTNNARLVNFNGTGSTQTITVTGGGTETFGYLTISKPVGFPNLVMAGVPNATNITLNGNPASGSATNTLVMTSSSNLDLNQNTFNFTSWNGNQNNIQVDGNTTVGSGTLTRNITSTGGEGVFAIYNNDAASHFVVISRPSANPIRRAVLIFGSTVKITTGAVAGGTGGIDFGNQLAAVPISTVNGILQIDTRGFVTVNAPTYGNGSTLIYNTLGAYSRSTEWSTTTGPGYPFNVTVQGAGTILTVNNGVGDANRQMAGTLTIANGSGLILNNSAVAFNLTILGDFVLNGNITLPGTLAAFGADIILYGNWTRSATGAFYPNERAVFFTGAGNSTITANNGETFPYLYFTKTAKAQTIFLNDDISITKILGIGTGTLDLQNKNVILKSGDTTASINQITSSQAQITYNGSGRFIVERYIPTAVGAVPNHLKSWQFLAVPVNQDNQSVNAAWQEGQAPLVVGTVGLGTIISNQTAGSGGFDIVGGVGGSMKIYVPLTSTWAPITGTNITHYNQKGYMLFVRGDRQVSTSGAAPTITTLRTKGKIMEPGNVPPITNIGANKLESVGNPYASAIDFSNTSGVVRAGAVNDVFYLWDPRLGGSFGFGAYQTCTKSGANYLISPGGGSYGALNSVQNTIQSGQAFFVSAGAGGGTITFNELAKTAGSKLFTRPGITVPVKRLNNCLYIVSGNTRTLMDGVVAEFDLSYSNNLDRMDAIKLLNGNENLGIRTGGKILAVERRANLQNRDTIFYNMSQGRLAHYQFEFTPENIGKKGLKAFLEDKYLGTRTPVSLTDTTRINFSIENVSASFASDRFRLVFINKDRLNNPFSLLSAENRDNDVLVSWKTGGADIAGNYQVERSPDGKQFTMIHNEPVQDVDSYIWKDTDPLPGVNYYRIHNPDLANRSSYSNEVKITVEQGDRSIKVYPNPVSDGIIKLRFRGHLKGEYLLKLYNNAGQLLMTRTLNHSGITDNEPVKLPGSILKGIYKLEILHPSGTKQTEQLIISY